MGIQASWGSASRDEAPGSVLRGRTASPGFKRTAREAVLIYKPGNAGVAKVTGKHIRPGEVIQAEEVVVGEGELVFYKPADGKGCVPRRSRKGQARTT